MTASKGGDGQKLSPSVVSGAFIALIQDKVSAASSDGRYQEAWRGNGAANYGAELACLRQNSTPAIWGVGCAIFSFVGLRAGGSYRLARRVRKPTGPFDWGWRLQKRGGAAAREAGAAGSGSLLSPLPPLALSSDAEAKSRVLGKLLSIPVDIFLSVMIGCSATVFLTDPDRLRDDLSALPLVRGRSLVSDDLCGDFVREFRKHPEELWRHGKMRETEPNIVAIHEFVLNCGRRRAWEKKRREERGMAPSDPVIVPEPGVPNDIEPNLDLFERDLDGV